MSGTSSVRIAIDETSLLVDVDASVTVTELESHLIARGLTLALDGAPSDLDVGSWLAEGAHGARDPFLDPADQVVAGLTAKLLDGRVLEIRPAPRRAVGPDLVTLIVGARGRFAQTTRAWLRVHRIGVVRPRTAPFEAARNPSLTAEEESLLAAIAREL